MKKSGIYKIQSSIYSDRVYIGSAVDLDHRRAQHLYELRKNKHKNGRLQNHYNKYGESDLVFSILVICSIEEIRPIKGVIWLEQFFIDSYHPYFNIAKIAGSNLGYKFTEEQRKKNSLGHMGQPAWNKNISHTEEHKQHLKDSWKKRGPVPEEHYRAMLESRGGYPYYFSKGNVPWNKNKSGTYSLELNKVAILQYDLQGNFIKEWKSATDAARELLIGNKNISACLNNKRPTAYGFIWKYKFEKEAAA